MVENKMLTPVLQLQNNLRSSEKPYFTHLEIRRTCDLVLATKTRHIITCNLYTRHILKTMLYVLGWTVVKYMTLYNDSDIKLFFWIE